MKVADLPRTISEVLTLNADKIEASIEASYERIEAAVGASRCTPEQMRHVLAQEQAWADDGKLTSRWTFSFYLKAMANAPQHIGVNLVGGSFSCKCDDVGWIFNESGKIHPCISCNQALYELWSAGCLRPNHQCELCAPRKRRRAPGASHRDEADADKILEAEAIEDDFQEQIF